MEWKTDEYARLLKELSRKFSQRQWLECVETMNIQRSARSWDELSKDPKIMNMTLLYEETFGITQPSKFFIVAHDQDNLFMTDPSDISLYNFRNWSLKSKPAQAPAPITWTVSSVNPKHMEIKISEISKADWNSLDIIVVPREMAEKILVLGMI